ncbi:ribose transport system substrate-binding protein [Gemmobacter aquatilis]|uniref:Ribose transport system substrate-binding protein n=1 Tax=Gemmobacter aquatilis TaxID=933059 RepID=A0A1H8MY10_9RHOB|nr:sugar ABC transporter substrate-binding protein [Gemmobacter aquatilis]SEO22281.1 ribose transport system substrate-binding protein [Gemmobacter aquatilis]
MKHVTKAFALLASAALLSGPAWAEGKHEIYTLLPNSALSGVIDPDMADRSAIAKALPVAPRAPDDKLVIGWTEITLGNPWFVAVVDTAKAKAEEYGYELDVQVADGDPAKTSAQIDAFIAKGVDVIVLDPTDLAAAAADAQRAVDAGIPVIALGTVPDDSPLVTTVLANPYGNGFEAGRYVAQTMGAEAQITAAAILGTVGNSTSESRVNGLITGIIYERSEQLGLGLSKEDAMLTGFNKFQELKNHGSFTYPEAKFDVKAMGVGFWTEEGGLDAAEDILTAHGATLNLILAENDFMGIGALTALENAGLKGKVLVACAADGFRVALDLVKSGDMLVTGLNAGSMTGQAAVELIHEIFDQGLDANNLPLGSYFPSAIVTKDTVDEVYDTDTANPFFKYTVPPFKTITDLRG